MTTTKIRCICGKKHTVTRGGQRKRCQCGALVWANTRPWVRIEEDSLAERKQSGKRVLLSRPAQVGREAGSSGVGLIITLAVIVLAIWFFWPALQSARAALTASQSAAPAAEVRPVIMTTTSRQQDETVVSLPDLVETLPPTAVPVFSDEVRPAPATGAYDAAAQLVTEGITLAAEELKRCLMAKAAGDVGLDCNPARNRLEELRQSALTLALEVDK